MGPENIYNINYPGFNSVYAQALNNNINGIDVDGTEETSAVQDLYKQAEDDAFKEAIAKYQKISEGIDSFTKEEDVEAQKKEANEKKTDAKEQKTKLEEFLSFLGIDTKEISSLEKEIDAFKTQASNIQFYTAAAVNTIVGDINAQADEIKTKAQQAKKEEETKNKQENQKSIIENENKEAKVNTQAEEVKDNPFILEV
ncbi:hypothetical protein IJ182_02775 [bacterium]|nr:hypothetical protein [bacterium]